MNLQQVNSVIWLAKRGFHGKTIAAIAGCSVSRVYTITKAHGFSVRDYRNGDNTEAQHVIRVSPYVKIRKRAMVA